MDTDLIFLYVSLVIFVSVFSGIVLCLLFALYEVFSKQINRDSTTQESYKERYMGSIDKGAFQ
jgi:Ca2+/Na+ antiporter